MLTTRAATLADAGRIAVLWRDANAARRSLPSADLAETERQVLARLNERGSFAVLAEEHGAVLAMAIALPARALDGASPEVVPGLVHVSMVAVRADRWGEGLGAVVLESVQTTARERGFVRGQLWTHETNLRGHGLYERLGWARSGRTKVDDDGEPIRHYVREL